MTEDNPPQVPRVPFNEAVIDELKEALQGVLLKHPEVASLAATVTWTGNLNDANIKHAVQVVAPGLSASSFLAIRSVEQTLKLMDHQMTQVAHNLDKSKFVLHNLIQETERRREQLDQPGSATAPQAADGPVRPAAQAEAAGP